MGVLSAPRSQEIGGEAMVVSIFCISYLALNWGKEIEELRIEFLNHLIVSSVFLFSKTCFSLVA